MSNHLSVFPQLEKKIPYSITIRYKQKFRCDVEIKFLSHIKIIPTHTEENNLRINLVI